MKENKLAHRGIRKVMMTMLMIRIHLVRLTSKTTVLHFVKQWHNDHWRQANVINSLFSFCFP